MKNLLVLLLALAAIHGVDAQPEHAYYGVSLGTFEYEERDFSGNDLILDETSSYRLMVGYQFMEHLTVEGGYGKTGTIRDTVTIGVFPSGTVDLSFSGEFQILTIRLLGVLPFDNGLRLLGGISYSDMKLDFDLTDGVSSASGDETTNEPGYYLGAGYDWDRVAVRLGFEKYDFGSGTDVTETSLSFFYKL
jgi:predicted porin